MAHGSRRQFLLGLGGMTAAAAGAGAGPARRILVIGAGLAGLTAARQLQAAGQHVIVLEARPRIGGRIHTARGWPDLPMDMGASWIHGTTGNPLTALARSAGAPLVTTTYAASLLLGPDGQRIDPDLRRAERILQAALAAAATGETDLSVLAAVTSSPGWQGASEADRRLVLYLINSRLEQEFSGAAGQLSAWYGQEADGFAGPDALFPGGFDQITRYLAQPLDIRLGRPVTAVAPGRVSLAGGDSLAADTIICTVPLAILQSGQIRFSQPFRRARQTAIDRLGMGLLNKCWLRFDAVHWPADVDWIGWLGPQPGVWGEWVSLARAMQAPVLMGFHAADQARSLEDLTDRETVAAAHAALKAMFGSRFPAPIGAQISRWGQDPFARGSYSFNATGTTPETRTDLAGADWDGQLWFAGEATDPGHYGTAHGAVLSGRAVAAAVLAQR